MKIPYSIESEMSLIASVLLGGGKILRKVEVSVPSGRSFYREANGLIYDAMRHVDELGLDIDIVTTRDELERQGILERVGGLGYIMQMGELLPTTSHAMSYANTVRYEFDRRRVIEICTNAIGKVQEDNADPVSITNDIMLGTQSLAGLQNSVDYNHVDDGIKEAIDDIEARTSTYKMSGVPSGWSALDDMVGGWRKGELIIVGARPSMGKSAFALSLSIAATKQNKCVLFASIEMSEKMTSQRLLAHETGISLKAISNSVLSLQEKMSLRKTRANLFDSSLYLAASNPMSMSDIRGKAIKLQSNTKIDLIVVDYLQMIATTGQNRTQEIGAVSRGLKALARELDCPVIALSSLNRAADKRDDKRPMMADLRESGDIESDADVIMFLYRASYYATAGMREAIENDECEVIVSKNRNGPVGSVMLDYTPSTGRFKDMEYSLL